MDWSLESRAKEMGYQMICGCDEAGAGPLAGRVYAAAVILPHSLELLYLNDSKKVTPKRRDALYDQIKDQAVAWAVAWAEAEEIDELDILNCRMLAMQRAIDQLPVKAEYALIDGNRDHGNRIAITTAHETVIGGDGISPSIAAASILAKVSRDRYMDELAEQYPEYEFDKHKGYPTKRHYELLRQYGPCPVHRRSFLKKL